MNPKLINLIARLAVVASIVLMSTACATPSPDKLAQWAADDVTYSSDKIEGTEQWFTERGTLGKFYLLAHRRAPGKPLEYQLNLVLDTLNGVTSFNKAVFVVAHGGKIEKSDPIIVTPLNKGSVSCRVTTSGSLPGGATVPCYHKREFVVDLSRNDIEMFAAAHAMYGLSLNASLRLYGPNGTLDVPLYGAHFAGLLKVIPAR